MSNAMHINPLENINSHSVYAEQVRLLYASMPAALAANVVASILMITAQWNSINHTTLIGWLVISLIAILLRLVLLICYRRSQHENMSLWGRLFDLGSSSSGIILGIAGVILFPAEQPQYQMLCAFVLVGMSAGAVSTLSFGKYTFPLYLSFTLIPLMYSFLLEGSQFSLTVLMMISLVYVFIFKSSRSIYNNTAQNIILRIDADIREQELLKTQQKQLLHVRHTPLAVIEWTTEFKVAEWNPAAETIFGYSRSQAIGMSGAALLNSDEEKEKINQIWDKLVSLKGGEQSINQNRTADGHIITCEWHNTPLINQQNKIIGVTSTAQDITQKIEYEARVIETNYILQAILNTIPARVFWKDRNNKYLGCNARFAKDAGLHSPNEIIGLSDFNLSWKQQAKKYQQDDNTVMNNDQPRIAYEEQQTLHDGNTVWIETSKIPLKDINADIYGVLGTYHDISVRKQSLNEILNAKEDAERANSAKSEFLSRMSHELRTPLNAILGFGQILQMTDENLKPQQKDGVKHILSAGRHLLSLINEVLDISKIDAGEMQLNIEKVDLQQLVTETISLASPLISKRNIFIEINIEDEIQLYTDKIRMKQVILNIITNAIKYNHDGGHVFINAQYISKEKILLCIKDTGQGIKIEDQGKIFEPFNRAGNITSETEGTGIGLTVTKKLLELMHSTIRFESTFGEGTEFMIEIPCRLEQ